MRGRIFIQFDLIQTPDPLVLDFRDLNATGKVIDGSAQDLKVNGSPERLRQSNGHILLSREHLKTGANSVELDFDSGIAESNRAVTRFLDRQDGSEYLYTLFVPMDASLAFPCFDQPDLKARFSLSVTTPAGWTVISNGKPTLTSLTGGGASTIFEETKPISTYANAGWSDLIGAFSRASGVDLKPWAKAWVEQRGMPQVEIDWACDAGKISSFRVRQKDALNEGHVWPIRTQVLLGQKTGRSETIAVSLDGAVAAVPGAIGKGCPDYVFGNDKDQAYGEFLLDAKSQAAVVEQIPHVADPFLRALLWGALWDSVRELRMAPTEYAELAMRVLPSETDAELAVSTLGRLRDTFTDYLSNTQRAAIAARFENVLIKEIAEAPTPDLRITWFRGLIAVATTPHARDVLKDLFTGRITIPGVPLKQRDRWNIIGSLIGSGDASGAELRDAESKRDKSDDGQKYTYVTGAAFAQPENKRKYFAEYVASSGVKEDWVTASLPMFNYWSQTNVTGAFLQPALDALPQLKRERKIFFVTNWLASFIGSQNSAAALRTVDDFLKQNTGDPDLRLKILEVRDELARTVRIRARWAA